MNKTRKRERGNEERASIVVGKGRGGEGTQGTAVRCRIDEILRMRGLGSSSFFIARIPAK